MRKPVRKFKETIEIRSSPINRIRSHRYFSIGLLSLTFMLACFVHIWQRVCVLELVKDVSHLRLENASLLDDATKLHAEIASLCMASRVENRARDSLGLAVVTADRMYVLVKEDGDEPEPDELAVMLSAIERVTRHMPVISSNSAAAKDLRRINLDSCSGEGGGR